MKKFMWAISAVAVCAGSAARACGYYTDYPGGYITQGERDVLAMPEGNFASLLRNILDVAQRDQPAVEGHIECTRSDAGESSWARTLAADRDDLCGAMEEDPDADEVVSEYQAMRKSMGECRMARIRKVVAEREYGYRGADKRSESKVLPPKFDPATYEVTLSRLPDEFAYYARGAAAYDNGDYALAITHFQSVFDFPEEQRKYRSTWAAFMLGRAWLKIDPAEAVPCFEQVRALAKDGFADVLNLAADSIGWQARAEGDSGDYAHAIQHYVEFARYLKDRLSIRESMNWVCGKALTSQKIDPALATDPLCRLIISAWLVSREDHYYEELFR